MAKVLFKNTLKSVSTNSTGPRRADLQSGVSNGMEEQWHAGDVLHGTLGH